MLGSGMSLITTVIGFGMSATFIVFIFARLICGRIRSLDSRSATPDFHIDLRSEPEHMISDLESVVIAALPTMKFDKETFHSREDTQCSICLGEYQEREILRILPNCGHIFHLTCIDEWLLKKLTCPVCRLSLQDSFEAKHTISPASNTAPQSADSPEIVTDPSYLWFLPGNGPSSGNGSNQEDYGSVARSLEDGSASQVQVR